MRLSNCHSPSVGDFPMISRGVRTTEDEREVRMRRFFASLLVTGALAAALAGPATAGGSSPAQLAAAGWDCFNVPGLGVHCMPPGQSWGDRTIQLLYFDTSDPEATSAPFLGTESLVRADAFRGNRQCPTENGGWFLIAELGYYACHRR
jgi:hypothetical protein